MLDESDEMSDSKQPTSHFGDGKSTLARPCAPTALMICWPIIDGAKGEPKIRLGLFTETYISVGVKLLPRSCTVVQPGMKEPVAL